MRTRQAPSGTSSTDGTEVTINAVRAFGRLLALRGATLTSHGRADGGLICEDRRNRAHPTMWRISPDGSVQTDLRYNHRLRAFVAAAEPNGL
jgi:hypothetical protein